MIVGMKDAPEALRKLREMNAKKGGLMLERLKNLDVERLDVDDLVALSAFGRQLTEEYKTLQIAAPEWLETRTAELKREIGTRTADIRAKRIREIKSRLAALKTTEEKKTDLAAELAALEAAG